MEHGLKPLWHPLNIIDEYLQSRGWTNDGDGWIAPEKLRVAMGNPGNGHFRRAIAAQIQIDIDEHVFA